MECHNHPGRESTKECSICGKPLCEECSVEIAGKTYGKECLAKIIGIGDEESSNSQISNEKEKLNENRPPTLEKKPETPIVEPEAPKSLYKQDPYDIEEPVIPEEYSLYTEEEVEKPAIPEEYNSYPEEVEKPVIPEEYDLYAEEKVEKPVYNDVEKSLNDLDYQNPYEEVDIKKETETSDDFIYPDHSYEPGPTSASKILEDKYEKYLNDLDFDDSELSLSEQLAKDEARFGSLTRKPYSPPEPEYKPEQVDPRVNEYYPNEEVITNYQQNTRSRNEAPYIPEEGIIKGRRNPQMTLEDQIRYNLEMEKQRPQGSRRSMHNIHYRQESKEPMGIIDILLTITLIVLIILVIFYIVYLFKLTGDYATFKDAVFGLAQPRTFLGNLFK